MTGYIDDVVFDSGLSACGASVTHMWIISTAVGTSPPTSYATANANKCGAYASPSCTYAVNATSGTGRRIGVASISTTAAVISNTTVAAFWAIVSTTNSKLFAAQHLTATQAVTNGNPFTLDSVNVTLRDPT